MERGLRYKIARRKIAQMSMHELKSEYEQWVEDEGHLTILASSVLREFIKARGYGDTEYKRIAEELGFQGSELQYRGF